MSLNVTRFAVLGLHGKFDIEIPIRDNKLILIGVNGLGKTTIANLLYFLLTEQWRRLLLSDFAGFEINANETTITISRDAIQTKLQRADRNERIFARYADRSPIPPRMIERIVSHSLYPLAFEASSTQREAIVETIANDLRIPSRFLMRLYSDLPRSAQEDLFRSNKDSPEIAKYLDTLKAAGDQQVIYLPTYRRIEQDIQAIFPFLDDEELRKVTARSETMTSMRNRGHVELIQFGMQDVETKIAEELAAIRERTRSQLTNLTATYLRDIIGNRADTIPTDYFRGLDDRVVQAVLDRVEEKTLSTQDKLEVQFAIRRIRESDLGQEARDKYLAYFFSRLLEIFVTLNESEGSIRKLVATCNKYLERKSLVYDDKSFEAHVQDEDGATLSWKVLSSGEKQVVSLFTHLYLSKNTQQTVVIDEPELSLSVPWQKSLLPDIVDTENCKLLIAVTHSPFIYANRLDPYVVDLSRCISRYAGASRA